MNKHDPERFAHGMGAKLAARSRHVCVLMGAGVSCACGLPDVSGLEKMVEAALDGENKHRFSQQANGRDIEQVLSRLRRIGSLIDGEETIDGMTGLQAAALDTMICEEIVAALDVADADLDIALRFAAWVARADYRRPVEVFTVNYDLLLESAFEELGIPYFDGFVGNLQATFRPELVEEPIGAGAPQLPSRFVRLWKLHGSVNWSRSPKKGVTRLGQPVPQGLPAAIYPSDEKYEESRRVPFMVLQDRFRRALNEPETLLVTVGYSFRDDHLNELLFDTAARRERSEFIAFCYDELPDELKTRARRTPNIQAVGPEEAIIGGVEGLWDGPSEPIADVWLNGKMALVDFSHLATYLSRSTSQGGDSHHVGESGDSGTVDHSGE